MTKDNFKRSATPIGKICIKETKLLFFLPTDDGSRYRFFGKYAEFITKFESMVRDQPPTVSVFINSVNFPFLMTVKSPNICMPHSISNETTNTLCW